MTGPRAHELDEVLRSARAVVDRPDRVLLVSGEAGIGKTHLVRAAADALAAEGFRVAWGRADPVERLVPYAAIAQVVASLPDTGPVAWDAAGVSGPDAVLLEVHRPVADLLAEQCVPGPLVIVIDDLHFADEDTLLLIRFLVRRLVDLPIVWVVTARDRLADPSPGLEDLLHQLREDDRLDELTLHPLSADEIEVLVNGVVGRPLDPAARDTVAERAAGNPFFAIQLALGIGEGTEAGGVVPSVSRRGALLDRVFPLGSSARAVARLASVFGDIDLDLFEAFARAMGLDVTEVQDGFDRLVRADLLRAAPSGRFEFTHDLVRETLYADLGPGERRRLHAAAARALLERRAGGLGVDTVELARHLSLSSIGPDADAADALREAGDALVGSSPRSAIVRYRQALQHLPKGDGEADLHVRLARGLHRAGEPDEVVRVCRQGLATADGPARDRLVRYLAGALADTGQYVEALRIIATAVDAGPPSVVLLTTQALLLRLAGDIEGARRSTQQAIDAARTVPERLAVHFQQLNISLDAGGSADAAQTLADIERVLPLLDAESRLMAHAHVAGAYSAFGESRRAVAHLAAAEALEEGGVRNVDWPWSFAARVVLAVRAARWDDALREYHQGAPDFGPGLRLLARNRAALAAMDVPLLRHDATGVRRLAADVVDIGDVDAAAVRMADAAVCRVDGRVHEAVEILEDLASQPGASAVRMGVLGYLIETYTTQGRREQAVAVLEPLEAWVRDQGTVLGDVMLGYYRARLVDAVDEAHAACALAQENGLTQYVAALRLELGRLGVDVEQNLLAGLEMFRGAGAVDFIDRCEAELRRRGLRVPMLRSATRATLTDAETKVALLVAEGLTNKAIAERLAYSVKTIEAYLSRVYAKTGAANRVELARRLPALVADGADEPPGRQ